MTKEIEFFKIPENKRDCTYIGLNLLAKPPQFVFPCQYQVKQDEYKREARKILTLLKSVQQDFFVDGVNKELEQFHSMIWLVQDYMNRGYYVETEKIIKVGGTGKINWKHTIKNNAIYFDHGSIIYYEFCRERNVLDEAQILTQIYKCCLKYSVEHVGFIFGVESVESSIYDIQKDKVFMTNFLNDELHQTFRDDKKVLLNHLLSIINNRNTQNKEHGFSIFDSEFEYVFEVMVNQVFGTANVKKFYNEYYYEIFGKGEKPASKLRPDTIMQVEDCYYIIDAKYYNYGYTDDYRDLPQSSAIAKQIGYNSYLRNQASVKAENVKSIFILPYACCNGEIFKYVGDAQQRGGEDYDKVGVWLVDLKTLIDEFLSRGGNLRTKLIGKLKHNQ